jgi:hypothetical protein
MKHGSDCPPPQFLATFETVLVSFNGLSRRSRRRNRVRVGLKNPPVDNRFDRELSADQRLVILVCYTCGDRGS